MNTDLSNFDTISLIMLLGISGIGIYYFSNMGKTIYEELLKRGVKIELIKASLTVLNELIPGANMAPILS